MKQKHQEEEERLKSTRKKIQSSLFCFPTHSCVKGKHIITMADRSYYIGIECNISKLSTVLLTHTYVYMYVC